MNWMLTKETGAVAFARQSSQQADAFGPGAAVDPGEAGHPRPAPVALLSRPIGGRFHYAASPLRECLFTGHPITVYEDLLFRLPTMILIFDGDGLISSINRMALEALGYRAEDMRGRSWQQFITPAARDGFNRDALPAFLENGEIAGTEVQFVRKNGKEVDFLMSAVGYKNLEGRIERTVAVFADLSRRAADQAALRQSEQRFRGSFEAAAHGMAVLTVDGRLAAVNSALKDMLGLAGLETDKTRLTDIVASEDHEKIQALMARLAAGESLGLHAELKYRANDGPVMHGLTSVSAVRDASGKIEQFIVQIVDITGRQKAEEHLRQAQKMEAVGQLTGGIAHDFNNLLTVIIGNLQLVENALQGNDKALKRAREAIDAAARGSALTKQLLAFARRQSLDAQEIDVNALIQNMEAILARSLGEAVELKIVLMDGHPLVVADPTQLETSVLNLCINARDAMPDGGRLTIETAPVALDAHYASEHEEVKPGDYVMIAVSDTGSGIPRHLLHKVFQPFFTTKEVGKGTGLGLSMVFGFIKQSGGHVKIYSEEGRGTSIKMYLPQVIVGEAASPQPEHKATILVVEDQEAVRAVAVEFLLDFGYAVLEAENAVQALQILQDNPDIDLLFTDVVMPGGMNGFDLSQAASQIRPDLKIIHASGYPKGAMVHQEEPRLKDNLISKPYRRDDLRRVVEDTLAGKGKFSAKG
jgi:PAS domain S-box-containing protein